MNCQHIETVMVSLFHGVVHLYSFVYLLRVANSEDLDEIPHYATFNQGLHGLQGQKQSSEEEINFIWK